MKFRDLRPRLLAVAAIYLAVQVALPVRGLLDSGVNRWSWEMFSRGSQQEKFRVVRPDGDIYTTVQLVLGISRYEIQYDDDGAEILCSYFPEALSVESETGTVTCER